MFLLVCSEEEIIDNPSDEDAGSNGDDNVPVVVHNPKTKQKSY